MADFTAPSFSLGLDFDPDSEPQITVRKDLSPRPARQPSTSANLVPTVDEFGDNDFESPTVGPGPQVLDPPRTLKRLRRGGTPVAHKPEPVVSWCNVDDEIEAFSSQEDKCRDEPPSTQYRSLCSSSKLSLPGHGVLTTQSERERKNVLKAPSSTDVYTSRNKLMFPMLTVSPLRRFQLIDSDSDSDDPSCNDPANLDANIAGSSSKERHFNYDQHVRTKASGSMSHTEDLWNSFCSEKSFHIPTPAFDEVCDEYFRSTKDRNDDLNNNTKGGYESSKISTNNAQQLNFGDHLPPAHCYFLHHDIRIQNLVRNRLPNFFPLGAGNTRGFEQPSASVIDYMGQFSHGQSSKQAAGKKNAEITSTTSRKKSKKIGAEEVSQGSGNWVNLKGTKGIPKDAGKRRVQAVGQTAGHWYTGSNGKRVYVTKTGQELTGQVAYRHYKKESQGRSKSKRSRKKTGSKKK